MIVVVVQPLGCVQLCDPMDCRLPCPSLSLLKLLSIESVMPSNHLILCRPFVLLPFSRGSTRPRDQTWVFHIAGRFFTI